jgi:hypothetical protein
MAKAMSTLFASIVLIGVTLVCGVALGVLYAKQLQEAGQFTLVIVEDEHLVVDSNGENAVFTCNLRNIGTQPVDNISVIIDGDIYAFNVTLQPGHGYGVCISTQHGLTGHFDFGLPMAVVYEASSGGKTVYSTARVVTEKITAEINKHPQAENETSGNETVNATLNIDPDTLNFKSQGNYITAYMELPEGENVNTTTIYLNGTIPVEAWPIYIGDTDEDGLTDFMVKFNRQAVIQWLRGIITTDGNVTLTVTGNVEGKAFEGSDAIRCIHVQ